MVHLNTGGDAYRSCSPSSRNGPDEPPIGQQVSAYYREEIGSHEAKRRHMQAQVDALNRHMATIEKSIMDLHYKIALSADNPAITHALQHQLGKKTWSKDSTYAEVMALLGTIQSLNFSDIYASQVMGQIGKA